MQADAMSREVNNEEHNYMTEPVDFSLKVKNYKCFGDKEQGFDKIYPINVIIGRNNTGKSSLLELVEYATHPNEKFMKLVHRRQQLSPQVIISQPLQEAQLKNVFPDNMSGSGIPGQNPVKYRAGFVGAKLKYDLQPDGKSVFLELDPPFIHKPNLDEHHRRLTTALAQNSPLLNRSFKRLSAERDVSPEDENDSLEINPKGFGATNIIQRFINFVGLPSDSVEKVLLKEINKIYEPDSSFSRISVQKISRSGWEIFLEEDTKGSIALSHTGSGFKTILLVLVLLYLVPHIEQKDVKEYVYAFEELENNMHPALQRRLLLYLRRFALEHGCRFFLTTHSNIVIDMFSSDDQAQIIHVTHDGEKATVRSVQTYIDNGGILDDLDVRASDLLQSNCIVWVEGPSDRLYFNRWIDVWTEGNLQEGVHYQCMFYGGRLLAHISAEDPDQSDDGVSILRLNRHAVIIADSDKSKRNKPVNETKNRITAEIQNIGGLAWITEGREIENYIPLQAIEAYFNKPSLPPLDKYEDISVYLDRAIGSGTGKIFEKSKVDFAAKICPIITKDNIQKTLDMSSKLAEICSKIREWNNIT